MPIKDVLAIFLGSQCGKYVSGAAGAASSCRRLADCAFKALCALVCEVAIDDEQRVYYAGHPKQEAEKKVEDRLKWLPAKKHGDRGQDDCQQIAHRCPRLRIYMS